ncbi:MAG TPA: hypothetical protein ACFYEC_03715 [Candidatus Brocadiaceae bacterium]
MRDHEDTKHLTELLSKEIKCYHEVGRIEDLLKSLPEDMEVLKEALTSADKASKLLFANIKSLDTWINAKRTAMRLP